ncbi:MAG TPA: SRPBCC family protein [Thermoanaerobaculia bacterium]|nr:SRPBCC family protein [Thermoanaerobaculia bacterium]
MTTTTIETFTEHATFTIERDYPVPPARVFRAWAEPEAKARWFFCHDDWRAENHQLDCRAGGSERVDSYPSDGGEVHAYRAHYYDVVPDERIVYAYEMYLGDKRMSVSLVTVLFEPRAGGARMTFTEQLAAFDERWDGAGRELGTREGLDNLGRFLTNGN